MRNFMRKTVITTMLILAVVITSSTALADSPEKYLALGADLSSQDQVEVLRLLGVENVNDCEIVTVTNKEEHQYLDEYLPSAEIGTQALSSVLIEENSSESINVETYNIDYCTEGMYRNALATAGVRGADVKVAGPFSISGTAALVGSIKAYEKMSGNDISDDVIESSVDELVTTGEVADEIGDKEKAEAIIATAKDKLAENPDMTEEEIAEQVQSAAEAAGVEISDEAISNISEMMGNMQASDIDWNNLKEQSENILGGFGDLIDTEEAKGIFGRILDWIKSIIG